MIFLLFSMIFPPWVAVDLVPPFPHLAEPSAEREGAGQSYGEQNHQAKLLSGAQH